MAYTIVLELEPPLGPVIPINTYEFGISGIGGNKVDTYQGTNVFPDLAPGPRLYVIRRIDTKAVIQTGVIFNTSAQDIFDTYGKIPLWSQGVPGANGLNGYSPVFGFGVDGERLVLQVEDWTGGSGPKPPTDNIYIGLNGFTKDVSTAINLKGFRGSDGRNGNNLWIISQDPVIFGEPSGAVPLDYCINSVTGTIWKMLGSGRWLQQSGNVKGPQGPTGTDGQPGLAAWTPQLGFAYNGENVILQIRDWVGGQGPKPPSGNVYVTTNAPGTTTDPNAAVNLKGFRGQDGRAGTNWFSGNYEPQPFDNPSGANPLDLFLHEGTGAIYKKLGSGRWIPTGGNLKGPGTNPVADAYNVGLVRRIDEVANILPANQADNFTSHYSSLPAVTNDNKYVVITYELFKEMYRLAYNEILAHGNSINSMADSFAATFTVDTYDQAKAKATGQKPLTVRVKADASADNNGTYDYFPDSTATDKLEKRIYSS